MVRVTIFLQWDRLMNSYPLKEMAVDTNVPMGSYENRCHQELASVRVIDSTINIRRMTCQIINSLRDGRCNGGFGLPCS